MRRSAEAACPLDPSGTAAGRSGRHRSCKSRALRFSICSAIGTTPDYTQAYLNAVMQKYLDFKKGMREDQGINVTTAITEQLIQVEKDLRNGEDEMLEFQKQNNIGFIQEEGNSAAAYLVRLNQQYAQLKTEYDLLACSISIKISIAAQGKAAIRASAPIARRGDDKATGMPFSDVGPEGDYLKAKQSRSVAESRTRHALERSASEASENHQAQRRDHEAGKSDRTLSARMRSKSSTRAGNPSANRWKICSPISRNGKRRRSI